MRALILFALACLLAVPAQAQPIKEAPPDKQDAAAAHFRLGVDFYRAGDYPAARVEFEAAWGLSPQPDLLHNLSLTAEKQGLFRAAIEYEERWLHAASLTRDELDQARGRILRLREQEKGRAPQDAPRSPGTARPLAGPSWRPPAGALALLAGGGAALVSGIACGGAALATGAQLGSGQAFTLREIETLTSRGEALNAATIGLSVAGGLALAGGGVWLVVAWKRSRERVAGQLPLSAGALFPGLQRLARAQGKDVTRFSTGF